jgi:eukaryotic-like serine/threonine-protein kinase
MTEPVISASSLIGVSFGPYCVRRKIGEGGMGTVYEGWDARLQRAVAIKTIRETYDSISRDRLWCEARSLARISHPNICQVFDVVDEQGRVVLVLELLQGQSLADRLTSGPMPAAEAVQIETQILQALGALHELGIVHRDLKPSNVFLTKHGVKLLDFGLVRTTRRLAAEETATALTTPGMVVGTPQYMAPEQARGDSVGPAADIFAAGCILYELLSGKRAFDGASTIDILFAVLHRNPPPLSGSAGIEALDRITRRAISKQAEDRFASAGAMLEAIAAIDLSGSAGGVSSPRTVSRLIVLPFRILRRDEETDFLAYSLPDAITHSLAGLESLIVRSTAVAARFADLPDPRRLAAEAEIDAFLTGTLMQVGGQLRVTCQLVEAPSGTVIWSDTETCWIRDLFRTQDELCERVVQALMVPLSEKERSNLRRDVPASAKAYEYYLRANRIAAVRTLDNFHLARDLYLQCTEEDPNYAPAWARLGRVYAFLEKISGESTAEPKAEAAFSRAFALGPDLAVAHSLYTPIECDQGFAERAMVRLLNLARSRRNDCDLFAGLVQACRYCDQLEASLAAHERAFHLDPQVTDSVAHTFFLLGDYQRTIESYGNKGGYYLDCAALAALGENQKALIKLREREENGGATGTVRAIMRSLRAYVDGDFAACLQATQTDEVAVQRTPESFFYLARQLSRIGETERAISILSDVLESGFVFASALARDEWLQPLRQSPRFPELLQAANRRAQHAREAFFAAEGAQVLAVALPMTKTESQPYPH